MSQETNTTGGSEPRPRLQIRKPEGSPPSSPESPAPAAAGAGALPRLSFAPKKRAEEPTPAQPAVERPAPSAPPPPPETKDTPLKRPPPGTRLIPSSDLATPSAMPAPLTPGGALTNSPFVAPKAGKARSNLVLWIALFVLVLIVGGESYYILMQDEQTDNLIPHKPPILVIGSATAGKPIDVAAAGAAAPTPEYAFLQSLNPEIAAGTDPRLFINSQTFHLGEVVAPDFGLRWVRIDDKTRELEFVDKRGQHYIKKF